MCAGDIATRRASARLDAASRSGGDEVWDADSDDVPTDGEDVATPRAHTAAQTVSQLPSLQRQSAALLIAAPLPDLRVRAVATPTMRYQKRFCSHRAKTACPQPALIAASAPRGLAGLLEHVRRDNETLRGALVSAQQDAEAAAKKAASSDGGVDFAHLLSLVRDFGEDAPELEEALSPAGSAEGFTIATPRGSEAGEDGDFGCDPNEHLRLQLAESQREVERLRAALGLRDEELASLKAHSQWIPVARPISDAGSAEL